MIFKFKNTINNLAIALLLAFLAFPIANDKLLAQTEKNTDYRPGVTITPAIVEKAPGESYDLIIINNTGKDADLELYPGLFAVDARYRSIVPARNHNVSDKELNEIVKIQTKKLKLPQNETTTIKITYGKAIDKYIPGVIIADKTTKGGSDVAIQGFLASVIVDTRLSEKDLALIIQDLDVNSNLYLKVFGVVLNFGDTLYADSLVQNNSPKIINPTGEVLYIFKETKQQSAKLTPYIRDNLYPQEKFTHQAKFKDNRKIWDRIGKGSVRQEIKLSNKQYSSEVKVYSIPFEIIIICAVVMVATAAVIYYSSDLIYKKFKKKKRLR